MARTKSFLTSMSAFGRVENRLTRADRDNVGIEIGLDLAVLDAILDVGLDPVLHVPDGSLGRGGPG